MTGEEIAWAKQEATGHTFRASATGRSSGLSYEAHSPRRFGSQTARYSLTCLFPRYEFTRVDSTPAPPTEHYAQRPGETARYKARHRSNRLIPVVGW